MVILYHHRTRATDAQRIHILEMIRAFQALGHEVEEAALVPAETELDNPERDARQARWQRLVRRLPLASEAVQLAYNFAGVPMLVRRIRRRRPDFIYERYSLFNFAGVLAGRVFRIPVVVEINSPLALEQARDRAIRWHGLARWAERRAANAATHVIAVSVPLRDILVGMGVSPEKITVIPNGVDPERFRPRPPDPQLRRRLGLAGRVVAGFVGWFRNWHRTDLLIEALASSKLLREKAAVLLVGDGPETPRLKELAARRGIEDIVRFTGPLPHRDVAPHVALFDIAVQPAANEYCCPMKVIEYLAAGKPVVAPDQPNLRHLVEDGVEAVLFAPGSAEALARALERLVDDEDLRARMGRAAAAAIERRGYLWKRNAERVLELVAKTRGCGEK